MSKEIAPARYHPLHAAIHWLMFLLVIMMLGVGKFVMPGIPVDNPQKPAMLQTHAMIGITIAVLLVVRIVLLFTAKRPAPADAGNAGDAPGCRPGESAGRVLLGGAQNHAGAGAGASCLGGTASRNHGLRRRSGSRSRGGSGRRRVTTSTTGDHRQQRAAQRENT